MSLIGVDCMLCESVSDISNHQYKLTTPNIEKVVIILVQATYNYGRSTCSGKLHGYSFWLIASVQCPHSTPEGINLQGNRACQGEREDDSREDEEDEEKVEEREENLSPSLSRGVGYLFNCRIPP